MSEDYDYDWIIIGSGFGGSVSALRLAEKGYRVAVIEAGARFADEDFAEDTKQLNKWIWAPALGLKGIMRMTLMRDIFVLSGAGVGGGSLVYGNTLYRALPTFYSNQQWSGLADWRSELAAHYETAERMLGVVDYDRDGVADDLLREYARELGVEDTARRTPVGVFLGEPGVTVDDPFFGGDGPRRTGCTRCGACMVGCREGAKNTLEKNYLWFAEKRGVEILPLRTVTDVRPLGREADGSQGYRVQMRLSGAWGYGNQTTLRARGVVFAAGALGTNRLLARCRANGSLPAVSDRLGCGVRTNSESIVGATAPAGSDWDFSESVAISSSIYIDEDTHIEPVVYGAGGDMATRLATLLVEDGTRKTKPLHFLAAIARRPADFWHTVAVKGAGRRMLILLVMQSLENSIQLKVKHRWPGGGVALTTEQDPEHPNPDQIPGAYAAARWLAKRIGGRPGASVPESVLGIPITAHILGGAVIGADREHGVIDSSQHVFGYQRMLVCDGSAIPANIGVNPSLTITALAERAMSFIPDKPENPDFD